MMVIAIDGPAGSGKSTVARRLAVRLGLEYLDTGAMYRGVTFAALRRNLDPADGAELAALARNVELEVADGVVTVDGVDASVEIRGPEVTRAVSIVAANPEVRSELEGRGDLAALYAVLQARDPLAASRIEPGNRRRIVRALEVCFGSGRTFSSFGEGLDAYPANDWDVVALSVEPAVLAERIADRIRRHVAGSPFRVDNGAELLTVTISVGVAATLGAGDSPEALLKRADEAVYEAKAGGRNRVITRAA